MFLEPISISSVKESHFLLIRSPHHSFRPIAPCKYAIGRSVLLPTCPVRLGRTQSTSIFYQETPRSFTVEFIDSTSQYSNCVLYKVFYCCPITDKKEGGRGKGDDGIGLQGGEKLSLAGGFSENRKCKP